MSAKHNHVKSSNGRGVPVLMGIGLHLPRRAGSMLDGEQRRGCTDDDRQYSWAVLGKPASAAREDQLRVKLTNWSCWITVSFKSSDILGSWFPSIQFHTSLRCARKRAKPCAEREWGWRARKQPIVHGRKQPSSLGGWTRDSSSVS